MSTGDGRNTANHRGEFDLSQVYHLLEKTLVDETLLDLKLYCESWMELTKFLDTLGTLFHFVTHDVKQKVFVLQEYIAEDAENYSTINGVIEHEVKNSLTKTKKPSGSRTILRLHRALNYILVFFEKLVEAPLDAKCSVLSSEAYNQTLGNYHSWIVRKAANLAMYSLPQKDALLHKIDGNPGNEERVSKLLKEIVSVGKPVYSNTEDLFSKNNLLDLP